MKWSLESGRIRNVTLMCALVLLAGAVAPTAGFSAPAGILAAQPVVTQSNFTTKGPDLGERSALNKTRVKAFLGSLPLVFETNRGQTDSRVEFLARGSGYTLFLTRAGMVVVLGERPATEWPASGLSHGRDTIAPRDRFAALTRRKASAQDHSKRNRAPGKIENRVLRMMMVDANPRVRVEGLSPLPAKVSYFVGKDPRKWVTGVPTFARVRYRNLYPGIDLIYYGNDRNQLEYDFILAPGANPDAIRLRFDGAQKLTVSRDGDVVATLANGGKVVQRLPEIYEERDGHREKIDGRCVLRGKNTIGFSLARYDRGRAVSIDPKLTLTYSTYLGGNNMDNACRIAVDPAGGVYVVGTTDSTDFPTGAAAYQTGCPTAAPAFCTSVFVAKLDLSQSGAASLLYSTYLGGSFQQQGLGIAVDSAGRAYVTGVTSSSDFPTTATAFQSSCPSTGGPYGCEAAFVAELDPSASGAASLLYSTYLGGSVQDGGYRVAVDPAGSVYISGFTTSPDFPTTANAYQTSCPGESGRAGCWAAFVSKLDPSQSGAASLLYSTYLGGGAGNVGTGIAVDSAGNIYVSGTTYSTDFPTKNAIQSSCPSASSSGGCEAAFAAKLDPSASGAASLLYSTYLGGSVGDSSSGIEVDSADDAYVTGYTYSPDFPTTKTAFQRRCPGGTTCAFVAKLDPSASGTASLLYSSDLGPQRGYALGNSIAVDSAGNAYVTGEVGSNSWPTKDAFQGHCPSEHGPSGFGCQAAFVAKLDPSASGAASLVYSTYLGGMGGQTGGDVGYGIAVDSAGNAYVTGGTQSDNFPVTWSAFQGTLGGADDAFVTKLTLAAKEPPVTLSISPALRSFGRIPLGSTALGTFRVRAHLSKTSSAPVVIESVTVNGGFYSLDPATTCTQGQALTGDDGCKVVVDFAPDEWTKYQQLTGELFVTTNAERVSPIDGVVPMKGGGK